MWWNKTEAIKTKNLRVATDVFENEPSGGEADFENIELAKLVTCTPHIGASTKEAQARIGEEIVSIINEYF